MNRSLAFVSAVALAAAVAGCGLFDKEDHNYPPPATSAAPQPAPMQSSASNTTGTYRNGSYRASTARTGTSRLARTGKAEQTASATAGARSPDEVRKVQSALNQNGEDVKVDGRWGPQTSQALRDYQQKNGLQVSGQLDEQTKQKLNVDTNNNNGG